MTMESGHMGGGGVKKSPYLENRGAEAMEAVGQPVQRFQGVFTIVTSVVRCSVPQIKVNPKLIIHNN
jgi:hypothetical protein